MNKMLLPLLKRCSAIGLMLVFASIAFAQEKTDEIVREAKQFLVVNEAKLQKSKDLAEQYYILINLAPAALSAGDAARANDYAQQLFALGEKLKTQPGFGPGMQGHATHIANITLGRLALADDDVEKAKEYLLAAGKIKANPTLKTFGPNMSLAKQLIEKGERETAIKYFELCADFWEGEDGRLAEWRKIVKDGGMPDFKANLRYEIDTWRFAE